MAGGTSRSRFDLPGFNLPIDFVPSSLDPEHEQWGTGTLLGKGGILFRNALSVHDMKSGVLELPLTTLRELSMLRFMNVVTDKPEWHIKVFNEDITSKWKREVLSSGEDFTEKMAEACIAELKYKAKIFQETSAVCVFTGDVVKCDTAVPASIQEELKAAVKPLEDIPEKLKDWHPDSEDKVLDLVHPSLFPLVYGITRILPDSLTNLDDCIKRCGEGTVLSIPPSKVPKPTWVLWGLSDSEEEADSDQETNSEKDSETVISDPYSWKFQWLPCEVDISNDDGTKITSYINNLHPQQHKPLYSVIEKIIARIIPLWNMALTPLKFPDRSLPRIAYTDVIYDPNPELFLEEGPQQAEFDNIDEFLDRREEWIKATRRIVLPEPKKFESPLRREPAKMVDLKRDYGGRGLQVIVKLANIELTPEQAEYKGGAWHVEGQLNEHICASAIYYYDNDNVTPSSLAFRQQSDRDEAREVNYTHHENDWLEEIFGCTNQAAAVQLVGSIETKEGRVLTWPNILQHQVQPFKLVDPTKRGHRKILALFLVDPNIRIISTANVPCQRRDWWSQTVRDDKGGISTLPIELQDTIFDGIDGFPISLEEAGKLRRELMLERKRFVVAHAFAFKENQFSLCEH